MTKCNMMKLGGRKAKKKKKARPPETISHLAVESNKVR